MLMAVCVAGCASLKDTNESIIRVQSSHDTGKASRLTLLGVKAMEDGDIDRAADKFLGAVKADEAYGPAHNNLGLLHYEQGNFYQAVLAFERAMELMPHDPIVYYNLGITLQAAGRVHEALDLYWQAVEMDPANPYFLGNLVRLRVRLGDEGPEVTTQLQDLTLIETRPDWRRWADRQLALTFNESLDRGPETPEFNSDRKDRDGDDNEPADNVIDLTPTNESSNDSSRDGRNGNSLRDVTNTLFSDPEIAPSPEFNAPRVKSRRLDTQLFLDSGPMPIQDQDFRN
jgi:tetratricopeptide (TPR) repeat protein